MTTVNLNREQEAFIREYATLWVGQHPASRSGQILCEIAAQLPPPAYVPEVGDVVRVFSVKTGVEGTLPNYPEVVVAVTDELVITLYRPEACDTSPPACAYRIDAHRFEKVEQ